MKKETNKMPVQTLALGAMMTAFVILLQYLATYTTFFGPFSTAVGLIPIVIGAALCGPAVGTWLGLVFGIVVLLTGGAALFFAFHIPGTFITVLVKGAACGLAAGLVYKLLKNHNKTVAAIVSAVVCPVVNTGVFLLGCWAFFLPHANEIAELVGLSVGGFEVFLALAMANFLFEVGMNLILSPIIVRVIQLKSKLFK